jgi:hypothetical protein
MSEEQDRYIKLLELDYTWAANGLRIWRGLAIFLIFYELTLFLSTFF